MSNLKKGDLHRYFGVPMISYEDVTRFTSSKLEDFQNIDASIIKYAYKDVQIYTKGDYILESSLDKLADKYPGAFDPVFIETKYNLLTESGVLMPNSRNVLLDLSKSMLMNVLDGGTKKRGKLVKLIPSNFQALISYFCIYRDFASVYEEYILDKDESVEWSKDIQVDEHDLIDGEISKNSVRATCHLLLLLMAKNFSNDEGNRRTQVPAYLTNRLNAVRFGLKDQSANFLIDDIMVPEVNNYWNSVPNLKKIIFNWAISRSDFGEFSSALNLLRNASMSSIICMEQFITGEIKTRAHIQKKIIEEVFLFYTEKTALASELDLMWPYYRILHPGDDRLAVTKYPNLAYISLKYVQKYISDSESFKRVVNSAKPTIPRLIELMERKIPTGKVGQEKIGKITEEMKEGLKFMNIGVDVLSMDPPKSKLTKAQADKINELAQLLKSGNMDLDDDDSMYELFDN